MSHNFRAEILYDAVFSRFHCRLSRVSLGVPRRPRSNYCRPSQTAKRLLRFMQQHLRSVLRDASGFGDCKHASSLSGFTSVAEKANSNPSQHQRRICNAECRLQSPEKVITLFELIMFLELFIGPLSYIDINKIALISEGGNNNCMPRSQTKCLAICNFYDKVCKPYCQLGLQLKHICRALLTLHGTQHRRP